MGPGAVEDDDQAPFRIVSGGGSDLARISCSLRHDTAYKPHEVWLSMVISGFRRVDLVAIVKHEMQRWRSCYLCTKCIPIHGSSWRKMECLQVFLVVEQYPRILMSSCGALHQSEQSDCLQ